MAMVRIPAEERYNHHGPAYHAFRTCQNLEKTLIPVLRSIAPLEGADVVEMGAGSGPITLALVPHAKSVSAYELRAHMVETARANLQASGQSNWRVEVADSRNLPHPDASADLVIAAFTLGPMVVNEREGDWRHALDLAIGEMDRVSRDGATQVVLEGVWAMDEPEDDLVQHPWFRAETDYLESRYGFSCIRYRNDKDFSPLREQPEQLAMIFGEDGVRGFERRNWVMAECEGLWWRRRPL